MGKAVGYFEFFCGESPSSFHRSNFYSADLAQDPGLSKFSKYMKHYEFCVKKLLTVSPSDLIKLLTVSPSDIMKLVTVSPSDLKKLLTVSPRDLKKLFTVSPSDLKKLFTVSPSDPKKTLYSFAQ